MRNRILISVLVVLAALPAVAQLATPRVSQRASVTQTIGTTTITVDYHRPGVKGREIWGGLVPYDKPWRMGANEATTIAFTDAVMIEGTEVPAGKYSFFAIPGKGKWTLVINRDPEQWGAFGYDPAKDQLRLQVVPVASPHTEWMRFTIDPTGPASAVVTLAWDEIALPVKVDVDVAKIVWAKVDSAIATANEADGALWGTAAQWALDSGQRPDEGLVWAEKSIAAKETIFNLWTKARLLQQTGRAREALPVMEKTLAIAKGNVPQEFLDILQGSLESIRADLK